MQPAHIFVDPAIHLHIFPFTSVFICLPPIRPSPYLSTCSPQLHHQPHSNHKLNNLTTFIRPQIMSLTTLPTELTIQITTLLPSLSSLNALVRTSRHLHRTLTPLLYRRDVHTGAALAHAARHDIPAVFAHAAAAGAVVGDCALPLLLEAVAGGGCRRLGVVRFLLGEGCPVDARAGDGRTALHEAVLNLDVAAVEALLAAGADPAAVTKYGNQPLHLVQEDGADEIVGALERHGADLAAVDAERWSAVAVAVYNSRLAVVKALIDHGADVADRSSSLSLLSLAADNCDIPMLSLLRSYSVKLGAAEVSKPPNTLRAWRPPRLSQGRRASSRADCANSDVKDRHGYLAAGRS